MDNEAKLEELRNLLIEEGVDLSEKGSSQTPSKIALAALEDATGPTEHGSVWASWTRGFKQLSGECNEEK